MPDHLHLFVTGQDEFDLGLWVGTLKQALGKHIDRRNSRNPFWQRGFFDHVMRSEEGYAEKWDYVRNNPVRAGLVTVADDWPFAGEIVALRL
jgi:putative transposase